ncbi:hypothetical protein ACOMHN_052334 [Nucella lapillus]
MVLFGPVNIPPLLVGFQVWYWFQSRSGAMRSESSRERVETKMLKTVGRSAVYRLSQGFLQSAPQLICQLYIFLVSKPPLLNCPEGGYSS